MIKISDDTILGFSEATTGSLLIVMGIGHYAGYILVRSIETCMSFHIFNLSF